MNENYITVTENEWECRVKEVGTEEIQEFFEWLQGERDIDRMHFGERPSLSKEAAFSIIYYLQERLGVLDDKYELCKECKCIYDGNYCDDCRPD